MLEGLYQAGAFTKLLVRGHLSGEQVSHKPMGAIKFLTSTFRNTTQGDT